jgi:capsular polysaccharide biosynthesis protein
VANAIAKVVDTVAREAMDLQSINVIDEAKEPTSPSGPPRTMYTGIAFLAGIFLALAIIVLLDVLDTRVRNPEEIQELLDIPVIGYIPIIKG